MIFPEHIHVSGRKIIPEHILEEEEKNGIFRVDFSRSGALNLHDLLTVTRNVLCFF